MGVHQATCAIMFGLELGAPLLAFGPRRARIAAAIGIIALQSGLAFAGNYSYFNLLAAVLCLPLLDDRIVRDRIFRGASWPKISVRADLARPWVDHAGGALLGTV